MSAPADARQTIRALLDKGRAPRPARARLEALDALIALHATLAPADAQAAREIRRGFLLTLEDSPQILAEERVAGFLAEQIEPDDFAEFPWRSPDAVITYCEMLYSFRFASDAMARHIHALEQSLLRHTLQQYEQRGAYEQMFQLLRMAPTSLGLTDAELRRLHNRAHLYEMRRVRRSRRWLYAYLLIQVVLIVAVFPLLFIKAENGTLQRMVEEGAQVDLPPEAHRAFTYTDGLYWSVITAASIGYGDITPKTAIGKAIAATLGTMGVITIGVIAGLILTWISPRSID